VLKEAREHFTQGAHSKSSAQSLNTLTANEKEAIIKAYHGASYALLAKHYVNPYSKLESLKRGLKIINEAVLADALEVEIRFIRFSIEEHIPSFVSFVSHLSDDKAIILNHLKKTHSNYEAIKNYMLVSSNLTAEEKKKLN